MICILTVLLLISSLVSASNLFCQDSSACKDGWKSCEISSGEQWCCKESKLMCDESNQCLFLVPYLPFIQLRPGATEFESNIFSEEDKIFYKKHSSRKSKSTLNHLLGFHCEYLNSQKAIKTLKYETNMKTNATDINCPGRKQRCPPQNTCCLIGKQKYGCCRYTEAVCCSDLIHCCPPDTVCNPETMQCTKENTSRKMEILR
ncbi:progranulin-like [Argiope bruennichi]|uniref:progranulin-like n=1 Tax=Argiope bruennichi TaxID=94029 RepID=UPI002494C884|nr:progranulin-like [Argiope bruennichi]